MATTPAPGTVPAAPTPPADHYDEHTGVYGFFRRHQKKLLYTAGMFTLLTFSISGPMMAWAGDLFGAARPMPTIFVNGKRVPLQLEDDEYGTLLKNYMFTAIPYGVLPFITAGEDRDNQLGEVFAILRRAAIEEGIEFSFDSVDRAIEARRELAKAPTAAKMARDMGFPSLARYRLLVGEAMRVGTYVRLQTLALDSTEARVLQQVLSDREKITFRAAVFDEKKYEDGIKAAGSLTDDDLRKWLDGKTERDKRVMQAFDPPLAELRFHALMLADGQFDPAQWQETYLKDYTVSDDELKGLYEQEKELRFKVDTPEKWTPFDDATVKARLTRLAQAERVMNQLMSAIYTKQTEVLKPQTDEVARAQAELGTKQTEQAAKPDDPAAKEAVTAAQAVVTTAEEALKVARANFDFLAAAAELTKDKAGFVQKSMTGKKSGEDLKDLDAAGLELGFGKWPNSAQGVALRAKGDLGFMPGRTEKAVVLYQATDVEPLPLKPWEKLKPLAEGAYWTELAKKHGEDKKKAMEEALLRLAKAKMADKVTEIEGKKQERIDAKLKEWEDAINAAITKAEATLKDLVPGTQMHVGWQQELDRKKAELATKDARRTMYETEITKAIETEIGTEAKKFYKDVLDQAATEAGFELADIGPHLRDLQQREPRFDKKYGSDTVFLFRGQSNLKEGEATGVLQDFTNRRYIVAAVTKVEPVTAADVSRRDFESLRTGNGGRDFSSQQAGWAYRQAFTLEAVEQRYELKRPVGELREQASVK